jgi:hypothetical protein
MGRRPRLWRQITRPPWNSCMTDRFFVFGAGYSGKAFAAANATGVRIAGTTRSPEKFDALRNTGIAPILFDGSDLGGEISDELQQTTHLIISIAPGDTGDPVLNVARDVMIQEMPNLHWIGYLSTVGVYGDHSGA